MDDACGNNIYLGTGAIQLEQHAKVAVGLVLRIQQTLKLANPDRLNIPERIQTELNRSSGRMRAMSSRL